MESTDEWRLGIPASGPISRNGRIQFFTVSQKGKNALAHLFCRLVRESYGENVARSGPIFNKIQNSMRYYSSLA